MWAVVQQLCIPPPVTPHGPPTLDVRVRNYGVRHQEGGGEGGGGVRAIHHEGYHVFGKKNRGVTIFMGNLPMKL